MQQCSTIRSETQQSQHNQIRERKIKRPRSDRRERGRAAQGRAAWVVLLRAMRPGQRSLGRRGTMGGWVSSRRGWLQLKWMALDLELASPFLLLLLLLSLSLSFFLFFSFFFLSAFLLFLHFRSFKYE